MKKLIAQRPIRYMGQSYERGDALPVVDSQMVAAWLRAGSAVWRGEEPLAEAAPLNVPYRTPEQEAADVLASLDVRIVDDAGDFIGELALIQRIVAAVHTMEEDSPEFQEDGAVLDMDENGRFDRADLEKMTKAELSDLAAELGVNLSSSKTKAEQVEALAAVDAGAALAEDAT